MKKAINFFKLKLKLSGVQDNMYRSITTKTFMRVFNVKCNVKFKALKVFKIAAIFYSSL